MGDKPSEDEGCAGLVGSERKLTGVEPTADVPEGEITLERIRVDVAVIEGGSAEPSDVPGVGDGLGRVTVNRLLCVFADVLINSGLEGLADESMADDNGDTLALTDAVDVMVVIVVCLSNEMLVMVTETVESVGAGVADDMLDDSWGMLLYEGSKGSTPGILELDGAPGVPDIELMLGMTPELDALGEPNGGLWLVVGGAGRLTGMLCPFETVKAVVGVPEGPDRVGATTTGGCGDCVDSPFPLVDLSTLDDGTVDPGFVLVAGGRGKVGRLPPGGTLLLGVAMTFDPTTVVAVLPGTRGTEGAGDARDEPGANELMEGRPLRLESPDAVGGGPKGGGRPGRGVVVAPGVVGTSVLSRVGGP